MPKTNLRPDVNKKQYHCGKIVNNSLLHENIAWAKDVISERHPEKHSRFLVRCCAVLFRDEYLEITFQHGKAPIIIYFDDSDFKQSLMEILSDLEGRK